MQFALFLVLFANVTLFLCIKMKKKICIIIQKNIKVLRLANASSIPSFS